MSETAADVDARKLASPPYCAVTEYDPAGSVDVVTVAIPVPGLTASLQISVDGKIQKSFRELTFNPSATGAFVISDTNMGIVRNKTSVELLDNSGKVLVHWSAAEPVDGNSDSVEHRRADASQMLKKSDASVEEEYLNAVGEDKRGNHEAALGLFEEILKHDPDYIAVLRKLAMLEYLGGETSPPRRKESSGQSFWTILMRRRSMTRESFGARVEMRRVRATLYGAP